MKLVAISESREVLGRNAAVKMLLQKFKEENQPAQTVSNAGQSVETRLPLWQQLYTTPFPNRKSLKHQNVVRPPKAFGAVLAKLNLRR
jgi:hypothetical protein